MTSIFINMTHNVCKNYITIQYNTFKVSLIKVAPLFVLIEHIFCKVKFNTYSTKEIR